MTGLGEECGAPLANHRELASSPADETEEHAAWGTESHKAQDVAATAWAEVTANQPTTVAGAIALINCYLEIWSEHPIKAEHQASGA